MEAIYIPQLTKAPERTEVVQLDDFLPGLETLTPVRGQVKIQHHGNYLEVSGQAETIITLTCHRCLQQYNHRLSVNTSELIWLDESVNQPYDGPLEREVAVEDLVETLSPQGYFYPSEWLYEQLCLEIPQRQLCEADCAGIAATKASVNKTPEKPVDSRWASLEALKKQIP
ncbi:YceD family protein [Aliterella atlantica]|uniref:Metal-binding protein n=1 Tax=Aliterella atlantica CENA595 TaxID=1618023 RepID=A0A0D8ZYH0_9CYAN|nr:YceD family protein [Aliterella atlantica]KJH72246.1 metal-binding protein [Aliterella atlantica CENA595]